LTTTGAVLIGLSVATVFAAAANPLDPEWPTWHDPLHPMPEWVLKLEHQRNDRESSFRSLPLRKQIEYTAFRYVDTHPPEIKWRLILVDARPNRLGIELEAMIAEEPSDDFVIGLLSILFSAFKEMPHDEMARVEQVARQRISAMSRADTRETSTHMLETAIQWRREDDEARSAH
jgi:hypothetical protein